MPPAPALYQTSASTQRCVTHHHRLGYSTIKRSGREVLLKCLHIISEPRRLADGFDSTLQALVLSVPPSMRPDGRIQRGQLRLVLIQRGPLAP